MPRALIEAARSPRHSEVPIKTLEQQQLQSLHRLRSQWLSTRQRYFNTMRGILREFGILIALGPSAAKVQIGAALAEADSGIPDGLRPALAEMLQELAPLEEKITERRAPTYRSHSHRSSGCSSCARSPALAS